jgi:hypothetical protein
VFVGIDEAGGSALSHSLLRCCEERLIGGNDHQNSAIELSKLVSSTIWQHAYKFALVRNPFVRQVEMFYALVGGSCNAVNFNESPNAKLVSNVCVAHLVPPRGDWLNTVSGRVETFRKWTLRLDAAYPVGHQHNALFGSTNRAASGIDLHAKVVPSVNATQVSWLLGDDNKLMVNRVIKFETLSNVHRGLQNELCVETLPRVNAKQHGVSYSAYYDQPTQDIVARQMAADLTFFGYSFDQLATRNKPYNDFKAARRRATK